jgi:phage baseplate assembly protein W
MMDNKAIGINYPIQRSSDGYFDKTYTTIEHTKSNIINVLSTKQGERIGRPQFGTNLEELLFEPMSERLEANIRQEINSAIERSLPYVNVLNLNVRRDENRKLAAVEIDFTTPFVSGEKNENIEIFFELSDQLT